MKADLNRWTGLGAILIVCGTVSVLVFTLGVAPRTPNAVGPGTAPQANIEIGRAELAHLVDEFSEPEGYFDTDNFISNETSYLHVVDRLGNLVASGGVYLGVGPDQNLSYIVHAQPSLAIIIDIRRQNLLQHLLFKVLIEEAPSRIEFLCRLFSRDCTGISAEGPLPELLEAIRSVPGDDLLFDSNLQHVIETLQVDYGFRFSDLDLERIEYVYRSFFQEALDMRFSTLGRAPSVRYPTLEELLLETDLEGRRRSYLADEASFEWLQVFQRENRLIPVVGDFSGSHALRAVATFLKERHLEVSVFYTSNVEFYLFDSRAWDPYVNNVRNFPFSSRAVFLRAYFPTFGIPHPENIRGHRATSLIQSVSGFLDDAASGRLRTYWDVVSRNNR